MSDALQFWLAFFILVATVIIWSVRLEAKANANEKALNVQKEQFEKDLDGYKEQVEARFKEKKDTMEKNHTIMWETIDTFRKSLNDISQLIVRVETKLDIYSKKVS